MGVIAPLSEQLTKPLPNAMVLVNLKELSTGAYKLLPEGTTFQKLSCFVGFLCSMSSFLLFSVLNFIENFESFNFYLSGTRLVVSLRGDEPCEELEILEHVDATMILHVLPLSEDKIGRVHAARRYFCYSLEFL